jgi:hypothetical protein
VTKIVLKIKLWQKDIIQNTWLATPPLTTCAIQPP